MSREENSRLERREFMKKLGKYAVVTPPVVATLMTDVHAAANSNSNGSGTDDFCARNPNHNKCQ